MLYKQLVKFRSAILVFLTHQVALPLLRLIRNEEKFPYSFEDLQKMPEGSLGKQLTTFLGDRKLKLLPYYVRHDIKHILLNYDTTDKGEVCLQCFMLGNRHISFPVFFTVVFGIIAAPEHWTDFYAAYKRGRAVNEISEWKWFCLLSEPVSELQKRVATPKTT